jgi:hypothetical protein
MARPLSPYRKILVEDCEVICVSTAVGNLAMYGISFAYTRGGRGQRQWFLCPRCGRRMFKLYRPPGSAFFGCRRCHDLAYRCVQQHDARLDWLVKAPDWLLMYYMRHGEGPWRLLACRAGYAKLGVMGKY